MYKIHFSNKKDYECNIWYIFVSSKTLSMPGLCVGQSKILSVFIQKKKSFCINNGSRKGWELKEDL